MNGKRKIVFSFLLGVLVGGAVLSVGSRLYRHYWGGHARWSLRHNPQQFLKRFSRKLDLDAAQKEQIGKILELKHAELKALREKTRPQFKAVLDAGKSEIRVLLRSDQQEKFDKLVARFEKHREEKERRLNAKP